MAREKLGAGRDRHAVQVAVCGTCGARYADPVEAARHALEHGNLWSVPSSWLTPNRPLVPDSFWASLRNDPPPGVMIPVGELVAAVAEGSAADQCQAVYELLARYGVRVP